MKIVVLFLLLIITPLSSLMAQGKEKIQRHSWQALEQALKTQPKPIFIYFTASWCGYCKKIKRDVFTKPAVIDKINTNYYAVQMDVESTDSIWFDNRWFVNKQAKTRRNGIHELPFLLASRESSPFSLPATLFLNADFTVRERVFQYYTSQELLKLLSY